MNENGGRARRESPTHRRSTDMRILTFDYEYAPVGDGGGVVHARIAVFPTNPQRLGRSETVG